MPLYEVQGFGRDTNRRRKRKYEASDEEGAIFKAGDDGIIVEKVVVIGHPEVERAKKAAERTRKRVLGDLESFGVKGSDHEAMTTTLRDRFGAEPKASDVAWGLYNQAIRRNKDFGELAQIYFCMGAFLRDEGRDPFQTMQQGARMQVAAWKQSGVVRAVKVIVAPECCCECAARNGLVVPIDEALQNPPVPCPSCTAKTKDAKYPWCRCDMTPVVDEP